MDNDHKKTAVLLGWAGNIFEMAKSILASKEIHSVCVDENTLCEFEQCLKMSETIFCRYDVEYLVHSSLVNKSEFPSHIIDMSEEEWLKWKKYGYGSIFNVDRSFIKKLMEKGKGRYLEIGSIAGVIPSNGEEINGAVSASAFMHTKSLALEFAKEGISANAIALGILDDDTGLATIENSEMARRHIPDGNPIHVKEAAESIVELLTGNIPQLCGDVIVLDSGFSCSFMRDW